MTKVITRNGKRAAGILAAAAVLCGVCLSNVQPLLDADAQEAPLNTTFPFDSLADGEELPDVGDLADGETGWVSRISTITPDMTYGSVTKFVDTDTPAGTIRKVEDPEGDYIQIQSNPLLADMWNTGMSANNVSLAFGLRLGETLTEGKYVLSFDVYRDAPQLPNESKPGHLRMGASADADLEVGNKTFFGAYQKFQDMRDSQYMNRAHQVYQLGKLDGEALDFSAMSWATIRDPAKPENGGDYLLPKTWYTYRIEFDLDNETFRIYINDELMQRTTDDGVITDFKGGGEINSLIFGQYAMGKFAIETRVRNISFQKVGATEDPEDPDPDTELLNEPFPYAGYEDGDAVTPVEELADGETGWASLITTITPDMSYGSVAKFVDTDTPAGTIQKVSDPEGDYIQIKSAKLLGDLWEAGMRQNNINLTLGLRLGETLTEGKYVLSFDVYRDAEQLPNEGKPGHLRMVASTDPDLEAGWTNFYGAFQRFQDMRDSQYMNRAHQVWQKGSGTPQQLDFSAMSWAEIRDPAKPENGGDYLLPKTWYTYRIEFDLDNETFRIYINDELMQLTTDDGVITDFKGAGEISSIVFNQYAMGKYEVETRLRNIRFQDVNATDEDPEDPDPEDPDPNPDPDPDPDPEDPDPADLLDLPLSLEDYTNGQAVPDAGTLPADEAGWGSLVTTITPDMKYTNVEKYVDADTPAGTVQVVKEGDEEYIQIKSNPLLADMWNTGMDANKVSLAFGLNLGQKLTSGKYILSFEVYRNADVSSVSAAAGTPGHLRMGASAMAGLQADNASFAGAFQRFQDMRDSQYNSRAHYVLPAGAADGQQLDFDAMSWAEPRDPLAPENGGDYLLAGTWYKYRVEFDLDAGTFRIYINGDLMQRTVDGVTTTDFQGLKEIESLIFGYRALGRYWTEARLKNVRFRDARIPSDDEEEEIPGLQMEGVQKVDLDSLPDGYTFPAADSLTEIGFGTSIGERDGKPTGAVEVVKEGDDSYIRIVTNPQSEDIWAPDIDQQGAAVNFGLVLPQTINAGKYVLRFDIWRNSDESSLTATDNVTPGNMRLGGITTNENLAATNYTYVGPLMRWETLVPTAHVKREHKVWTAKAVEYTDLDVSMMNWAEPEGENNGPYLQPKTWYRYEVRFDLDAGTYQLYINGQPMQALSEDDSSVPVIDFAGFQEFRSVVFGFSSLGAYANEARIRNLSFSNASELLEPLPMLENEPSPDESYTVGDGQTRPVAPGKDPGSPDQPGNDDKPGDESDIPSTGVGLPLAGLSIVCLSGIAVMLLYRRRRHIR